MRLFAFATMAIVLLLNNANGEGLRIGMSADFPPWGYTTPSGEMTGFDRDVGDAICQKINATCTWTNQAFDGLLPSLQIGKYDMLLSGISITDERKKNIDFSIAYGESPYQFAAPANSPLMTVKTKEELEKALTNKIIGVQSGTTHEYVIKEHFKNSDIRIYERNEQMLDDLQVGRLDTALLEVGVWDSLLKEDDEIKRFGPVLTAADYTEFGQGIGVALKKGNSSLKARIDKAIEALNKDGTIKKLSEKYFGYDVSFKNNQ